jgi:hypothetical protein
MKNECRTAVEGVLGRKLTDKEADLLEQQFIKASKELPQKILKPGRVCQTKNVLKRLQIEQSRTIQISTLKK